MEEFTRETETLNIFEDISEEPIEVFLRVEDDFEVCYGRNSENKLRVITVKTILSDGSKTCFFQKQKPSSENNLSKHKLIIPSEGEKAIEVIAELKDDEIDTFTHLYSYRVLKIKETDFFNEPSKYTLKKICKFQFANLSAKTGSYSESFQSLFKEVDQLQIPVIDINKEKDQQIWQHYIDAMEKLVKQKEQVWKIQTISQPYPEKQGKDGEQLHYIDIFIDEKELINQFWKNIEDLFNPDDLEGHGNNDEEAFIEFKDYRELSEDELIKLKELGEENSYELSNTSPTHCISGKLRFNDIDSVSKEKIYSQIKSNLKIDRSKQV